MSFVWMRHVPHMNKSCLTYHWVMSQAWAARQERDERGAVTIRHLVSILFTCVCVHMRECVCLSCGVRRMYIRTRGAVTIPIRHLLTHPRRVISQSVVLLTFPVSICVFVTHTDRREFVTHKSWLTCVYTRGVLSPCIILSVFWLFVCVCVCVCMGTCVSVCLVVLCLCTYTRGVLSLFVIFWVFSVSKCVFVTHIDACEFVTYRSWLI